MAWTNVVTRAAGYIITATNWNEVINNLTFLRNGVYTVSTGTVSVGPTSSTTELTLSSITPPTFDGSTAMVLSYSWYNVTQTVSTDTFFIRLYDGSTQVAQYFLIPGSNCGGGTVQVALTPSAGSHTFTARIVRNSGTGTASVVAGGTAPMQLLAEQAG